MPTPLRTVPLLLLAALAAAQRPDAAFEHQKRTTAITYGAVPVGKHTLAELPVGNAWRLGMNEASTWQLEAPLVAGDTLIAPGSYRVQLQRTGETTASLLANGSGHALGAGGDGEVPGTIGRSNKPTRKLAIEWKKQGPAVHGNQPARIVVQFGEQEWTGDVTVLGHEKLDAGSGWKGAAFRVPAEVLERGAAVVATIGKGELVRNVVLGKDGVRLVPWMQAPTASFGFGAVEPPAETAIVTGRVEPLEVKVEKPRPVVELLAAKFEKGELRLELGYASDAVRLVLPEPKAKGK